MVFSEKLRQVQVGEEVLVDDWTTAANALKETEVQKRTQKDVRYEVRH